MTIMVRARTTAGRAGGRGDALRAAFAFGALALAAVLLTLAGPARAATYKWVDEKGVVHYTDKLPPEAVDKATVELSKQGIPLRKTEKALTPEQRRAIEQEEARQREVAKQQEEVARRDRALVSSYTSEAEIDLARNRSLQTINNVIQSSLAYTEQLNKRKAEAEAKKAQVEGKPMAATIDRELDGIDSELARQTELVAQKKRESTAITAKYDADKARWRELVAAKVASDPVKPAKVSGGGATAAPAPGAARK